MSELTDRIVENVEDSEIAEVVTVAMLTGYLILSQIGYIPSSKELTLVALAVIGAVVGLDTLKKKYKREKTK